MDPVQRLNYHTGLFLEEVEFTLEQNYHMLMRQRINYALFRPGVVYGMKLDYDGNILNVESGMAVDEFSDPVNGKVGREIVVLEDSRVLLDGFKSGDEVWITVEWAFTKDAPKPPTGDAPSITERATFGTSTSYPGTGTTKILLGRIVIGTKGTVTPTPTQNASLRLAGASVPPVIYVSATSLSFAATVGGANPAKQTLSISNRGGGTLSWTASDNAKWLTLEPTSGTDTGTVTVTVTTDSMTAGTRSGTITLSAIGATTVVVPVTFTIAAAPEPTVPAPQFDASKPFAPKSGSQGTPVTIYGTNFNPKNITKPTTGSSMKPTTGSSPKVFFGAIKATVIEFTNTSIEVNVPNVVSEKPEVGVPMKGVPIRVQTSGGKITSADLSPPVFFTLIK